MVIGSFDIVKHLKGQGNREFSRLILPQCGDRIDAQSAERGQVAGDERSNSEQQSDG